jgi:hypothetical protein
VEVKRPEDAEGLEGVDWQATRMDEDSEAGSERARRDSRVSWSRNQNMNPMGGAKRKRSKRMTKWRTNTSIARIRRERVSNVGAARACIEQNAGGVRKQE